MMTVKHVKENRHESVDSVESVSFDPDQNLLVGIQADGKAIRYNTGHAYVMNEHGKTVGIYNLRKK